MQRRSYFGLLLLAALLTSTLGGCSTAPKAEDQATFMRRASASTDWFESSVAGLDAQIASSAGYIIFPDVAQWGIIITGGSFGRGALCRPDGEQVGWAAINVGSIGLQAGVKGFRMLMVLQNDGVMREFMQNKWTGSAEGIAVAGEAGGSSATSFTDGVATYQGANTGLMAGVNVGLNYVRYEPLGPS